MQNPSRVLLLKNICFAEFDKNSKDQMLKIVKGNVKFYPGFKPHAESPMVAPDLNSVSGDSDRSKAVDTLAKDATIDAETKSEIKQLMPHTDDSAKS